MGAQPVRRAASSRKRLAVCARPLPLAKKFGTFTKGTVMLSYSGGLLGTFTGEKPGVLQALPGEAAA